VMQESEAAQCSVAPADGCARAVERTVQYRVISIDNAPEPRSRKEIPFIVSVDPSQTEATTIASQNYEYTLGIRNAKIGLTTNKNRGVFISKPVPMPVQSGEVRMKVNDTNYEYVNSYLDNPVVTTIEYSVTNKSTPASDKDWIPIVPSNYKGQEVIERLYPQSSGYGPLRFPASNSSSISLYKNGIAVDTDTVVKVRSDDKLTIIGLRIPASEFTLNSDDIYTVKYLPAGDPSTINFFDSGFKQKNLASAYDSNGAGEFFEGTGGSKTITLQNIPYVDFNAIESTGGYSTSVGLTGTYQPLTIVLNDGTTVYNYTNYLGLTQNELSSTDSNYAFLQSGRQIIFNKDINQGFRVFYQYEPSYLRYRVVFRVNTPVKVSPFVDSLTVKTKLNASILGVNNKKV